MSSDDARRHEALADADTFRQIAETIEEVFWVTDPGKQEMVYISPAYERVWGRSVESLYADPRSFLEAIHADDRERVAAALARQAQGGYHEEYRVVRPDGSVRWVRDRAFPVREADGAVRRITGIATDITERLLTVERTRQAASEIEERYRLLIETANDAVVTIDEDSRITDWNAAAERMFGWSRAEALGETLTGMIVPERHRSLHHGGMERYFSHGPHRHTGAILNRRVETHALHRDGREFDVELSVWPMQHAGRHSFSAFIRDISERKRAQDALAKSEERYRAVVENANEGIIVAQDGHVRYGNRKAFELTGRSAEEVGRTPFIELIHPDDRARVFANYMRRMRGEPVENHYNFRVVRADGQVRWLMISAVAIDWEGRPATLNFLSDVTETLALQDNLKATLAEREAILETSAVGIMFIRDGRIRWVNPALEQTMLGHAAGEMIGQTGEPHFPSRAHWKLFLSDCVPKLEAGLAYDAEWEVRRKDGSLWWCQMSGRALNAADLAQGTIWFYIDISARKRAEEEIRRALARERELSELKTRFVAMTSHEFKTPLAAILSSVELLEDFGDTLPAGERREVTNMIKRAVKRMTGMLDQVLLIGRAESDRLEFQPAPLDAAAFCESLLAEARRTAPPNVRLSLRAEGDAAGAARELDEKLLRHILGNLVGNAVKYSPGGGEVTLALSLTPAEARFTVSDQGVGIPAEDQPRLFEAFHRGRNVGNLEGTGLGLAIVRQCVLLHAGEIAFESTPGRGTTFTVTVPAPAAGTASATPGGA